MKTKLEPPKDRDFLGLVKDDLHGNYWDIFFWATKDDGVGGKSCFTDRALYSMPPIIKWVDLPEIEEE